MSINYNTQIQTNTADLQAILEAVNELPLVGSGDTSDATATSAEIFKDKTAYTADGKVTGTFTVENEITEQKNLISEIQTTLNNKTVSGSGNYKTCSLTISVETWGQDYPISIVYTSIENGTLTFNHCSLNTDNNQIIINNALCNSIVAISQYITSYVTGSVDEQSWEIEGNYDLDPPGNSNMSTLVYRIPQNTNNASIYVEYWE